MKESFSLIIWKDKNLRIFSPSFSFFKNWLHTEKTNRCVTLAIPEWTYCERIRRWENMVTTRLFRSYSRSTPMYVIGCRRRELLIGSSRTSVSASVRWFFILVRSEIGVKNNKWRAVANRLSWRDQANQISVQEIRTGMLPG